jgi:hypothetical protein
MTAAIATRAMEAERRGFTCVIWDSLGGQWRSRKDNTAVRTAGGWGE